MTKTADLAPVYFFASDEILLLNEAVDHIRQHAKQAGFTERQLFDENTDIYSRSLFGEKELLDLNLLNSTKLSAALQKLLENYLANPPKDKILIITAPKKFPAFLEKLKSKTLFKLFWPVAPNQLPGWIMTRLKSAGFTATPKLVLLLAEASENNLLAAQQYIDKLKLLYSPGDLTEENILAVITAASRYTVFDLINTIKTKNYSKIKIIFDYLRQDGLEPPILLWALSREARAQKLFNLLPRLSRLDDMIKGFSKNLLWPEFEKTCFLLAGRKIL